MGADRVVISLAMKKLLQNPASYQTVAQALNPYGSGRAARRLVEIIEAVLN